MLLVFDGTWGPNLSIIRVGIGEWFRLPVGAMKLYRAGGEPNKDQLDNEAEAYPDLVVATLLCHWVDSGIAAGTAGARSYVNSEVTSRALLISFRRTHTS